MESKEKEIKLENGTTIVFTGNLNKKKLDNLLWRLLQNFEERISSSVNCPNSRDNSCCIS